MTGNEQNAAPAAEATSDVAAEAVPDDATDPTETTEAPVSDTAPDAD